MSYIEVQVNCVLCYLILSPIILSIIQRVSYIEIQIDCLFCGMINPLIFYSLSNHSLYTLGSELHRSKYSLCIMNNYHIAYSFSNHSLFTLGSELNRSTSRLYIELRITTTSLMLCPIILFSKLVT